MRKIKNYYKSNLRCQIINYNKRILYLRFDFLYLLCIQLDLDAKRKGIIRLLYNTVRIHSHCNYESPNEHEKKYWKELRKLEIETV